jgi:hypothetical protein
MVLLKNSLVKLMIWLGNNDAFVLFSLIISLSVSMFCMMIGVLYLFFIGLIILLILAFLSIFKALIDSGFVKFDKSIYQSPPKAGETVLVTKDFYYDGSFRKYINLTDPSQKPNWWKVSKGTELVILDVIETSTDWKIRFLDQSKGDIDLYYLDTKKYWNTKANIRNNLLKKLGI